MKRWACVVASLYALIVAALAVPVVAVAFGKWPDPKDWTDLFSVWPVWLTLFVCQFAMLAGPVSMTALRPLTRWSKWPSMLVSGFMMAGLVVGAWLAFCECFRLKFLSLSLLLALGLITWLLWALVFFRLSHKLTPATLVSHQCQTLFKGSILELLIAVPSQIVASHRVGWFIGNCTFLGLAVGIIVMLFSFGPAVFLLCTARWRCLKAAPATCETDPTPHLMSRTIGPLTAFGVLACTFLALGLSFVVKPAPTEVENSGQMLQGMNKEFEKNGWVSDGKGGWTSDTNRIQGYKKLNAEMDKAGWTTVSNGHYILPTDSELPRPLKQEQPNK